MELRLRKCKITPQEVVTQYVVGLRTMEEIAKDAGVTRQAIKLVLDRMGVEYRGGKVKRECGYCGGEFNHPRNEVKQGRGMYCSPQCFASSRSLGGDMTVHSRLGRAAWVMAGRKIKHGQVIHHIDGDRTNNSLDNLRLFNSQREHMQYHHSLRRK